MYNLGGYQIMTKKNIWVKLLIVALIIAMVGAFFIACDDDKTPPDDGKKPDDGEDNEDNNTEEAVNALLGVIDDAIAALGGIDNVGNLGTDAYIDLAIEQEGVIKKIRVDLDLSLDLLNSESGGDGYINNGFGFAISVDDGDGVLDRVFGAWYVDTAVEGTSYIYLSAGGQNFKIDGLTLASVLEKYNVNANVEVGSKLQGIGSLAENPDIASFLAILPDLGINIGYEKVGNQEVFSLNIKELFNPSEDNALGATLDQMIFQSPELAGILSSLNIAISSVGDVYNMIPNIDLEIIGNYNAAGTFESIGLGLAVDGKSDGITIPTTDGKGMTIIEGSFPDTNLSATLGFKILSGDEAYNNVAESIPADAEDWNNIGALNFAVAGQVTLGKTAETAKTYDVEISADINLAAAANATFVKKLYFNDADGNPTSKDWFYLRGVGPFESDTDKDIIDVLLPAINSLYVKMVNVENSNDILLINLDEKITTSAAGDFNGGKMTIKLSALTGILETFGVELPSNVSGMISGIEGDKLPIGTILGAIKPVLSGFIYKSVPEGATTTAPKANALNMAEAAGSEEGTEDSDDVMTIIMEVIEKVMACVKIDADNGKISAAADADDKYYIGGAAITFDMAASLLKDKDNKVNGAELKFNKPLVLDYKADIKDGEGENAATIGTDTVKTTINVPSLKIGGDNNLFSATVSVTQDKAKTYTTPDDEHQNESSKLEVYVGIDLEKIGYGCATRTPVVLDSSNNPTGSIFTNIGWVASK